MATTQTSQITPASSSARTPRVRSRVRVVSAAALLLFTGVGVAATAMPFRTDGPEAAVELTPLGSGAGREDAVSNDEPTSVAPTTTSPSAAAATPALVPVEATTTSEVPSAPVAQNPPPAVAPVASAGTVEVGESRVIEAPAARHTLAPGTYTELADNVASFSLPDGSQASSMVLTRGETDALVLHVHGACEASGQCDLRATLTNTSSIAVHWASGVSVIATVTLAGQVVAQVDLTSPDTTVLAPDATHELAGQLTVTDPGIYEVYGSTTFAVR